MSKNTGTSELINYFDLGANGDVGIAGSLDVNTIANATTDTDKFLVSDTGIIKYRTGAELLTDIGAQGLLTNPVTGTGSAGQVAYWSSSSAITGESTLFWDATNDRLGIGTASPAVSLHVEKNSGTYELIQIQNNSAGALLRAIGFGGGSADFGADDTAASTAVIRTAGTERMRITLGGNVGIATTNPVLTNFGVEFTVSGVLKTAEPEGIINIQGNRTTDANIGGLNFFNSTNYIAAVKAVRSGANNSGALSFETVNAGSPQENMRITSGGNVGIGTQTPDTYSFGGNRRFLTISNTTTSGEGLLQIISSSDGNGNIDFGSSSVLRSRIIGYNNSDLGFFTNTTNSGTGASLKMVITSGGNVGIGEANPTDQLVLKRATYPTIELKESTDSSRLLFQYHSADKDFRIKSISNHALTFGTNDTERMRIWNSTGNVNIGLTPASDAGFKLDVNGTGRFSGELTGTTASFTSSSTLITLTSNAGTKAVFATTRNFGVNRNFQIAVDEFAESAFTITPSTTLGGSGYTTPIFTLAAAGAATFSGNLSVIRTSGGSVITAQATATNGEAQIDLQGKNSSGTVRNATFKYDNADIIRIGTSSNIAMRFETNDVDRMRITSGGNVLIGNPGSDNGAKLQVNGGITVAGTSALADNELRIRGLGDANHAIVNNATINGPLSYGYLGSGLGWTEGSSPSIALMNVRGNVLIGTTSNGSSKLRIVGLPTSSAGLSSGDIWNDGGTLKIA
jgi:uncharacterized protein YaiE (UPF0345 family)